MKIFASLFMGLLLAISGQAQEAKEAPQAHMPTLTTAQHDSIALLATKKKLLEAQAALTTQEYQKKLEQMQADYAKLTADLNAKADELFKQYNLDRSKVDLDLDSGKFIPLPAAPAADDKK